MEDIKKRVEGIIYIVNAVYKAELDTIKKKQENLGNINIDVFAEHIQVELEKGNIETDEDIVRLIEMLIQD